MYNKIQLIGRAGRDPETRTLEGGIVVTNLTIATTETWKDAQGNKQEKTTWHNVQAWRKLAEIIGQYAKKGGLYMVEGKMTYREYEKDGVKRIAPEIVAEEFKMLEKPAGSGSPAAPAQQPASRPAPTPADDEDLPF
jgi:single-strand DNA-binding protein